MRPRNSAEKRRWQKPLHYAIEPLEPRQLLATFNAPSTNDSISISGSGLITHVVINGVDNTTADSTIIVNGNNGNDTITVSSMRSASSIIVSGGIGDDTVQNSVFDIDGVFDGDFFFNGGTGTDTFTVDNGADATSGAFYRIESDRLDIQPSSGAAFTLFTYSEIDRLTIADNDNPNSFEFKSASIAGVNILGRGGNDVFRSAGSLWRTSVGSSGVTLNGGTGTDTIFLSNNSDTVGADYTVTSTMVDLDSSLSNVGPVRFSSSEALSVGASNQNDTISIDSVAAGMSVTVSGLGGDDTLTAGGGDIDSNAGAGAARPTLIGGPGTDVIRFDDHLDAEGDSETYTFAPATTGGDLQKGAAGFNYRETESLILDVANRVITTNVSNLININRIPSPVVSTTINGGALRACTVVVGDGTLSTDIASALAINLSGGASNIVNVNNQSSSAISTYRVTSTQLISSILAAAVSYSGVGVFKILAGSAGDAFFADTTPAGTELTFTGNDGGDTFALGDGNIDQDLLGKVIVSGGTGSNYLEFVNNLDTTVESQTLTGSSFTDGLSHSFTSINSLRIVDGPGGTNLTINQTGFTTVIDCGEGNDTLTVGGGDINTNFPATEALGMTIFGHGGTDRIRFNDLNDDSTDQYILQSTGSADRLIRRGLDEHFVSWKDIEAVTLDASNAPSPASSPSEIIVTNSITPLRINGNAGSDRVSVADSFVAPVIVNTGIGEADQLNVNSDFVPGDAAVTVVIDQSDDVEVLDIKPNGIVRVLSGAVLTKTRVGGLSAGLLSIAGTIDLAGGAFISRAGGPTSSEFRTLITNGRNGGVWNGTSSSGAINSSLANSSALQDGVGYGLGSEIAVTSIGSFTIGSGDTLIRYTLDGDASLEGKVNALDFNALATNFGSAAGKQWVQADINYDGQTNTFDFTALAMNFNQSVVAPSAPLAAGNPAVAATGLATTPRLFGDNRVTDDDFDSVL